MLVHPLPYLSDSCEYFARLRHLPGAVFLDSARPHCAVGRFDLMSARPLCELRTQGPLTQIITASGIETSARDPFELLDAALATHLPRQRTLVGEWPFSGGAIGFFGYELGRRMARLPMRKRRRSLREMQVGIYPWALMQDHDRRQCALIFSDAISARATPGTDCPLQHAGSGPGHDVLPRVELRFEPRSRGLRARLCANPALYPRWRLLPGQSRAAPHGTLQRRSLACLPQPARAHGFAVLRLHARRGSLDPELLARTFSAHHGRACRDPPDQGHHAPRHPAPMPTSARPIACSLPKKIAPRTS